MFRIIVLTFDVILQILHFLIDKLGQHVTYEQLNLTNELIHLSHVQMVEAAQITLILFHGKVFYDDIINGVEI